jgi:hypothetical protein
MPMNTPLGTGSIRRPRSHAGGAGTSPGRGNDASHMPPRTGHDHARRRAAPVGQRHRQRLHQSTRADEPRTWTSVTPPLPIAQDNSPSATSVPRPSARPLLPADACRLPKRDETTNVPHDCLHGQDTMPILQATETGTGRIRTFSWQRLAVLSDAVALSLIAASQRGTGVWIRRASPAVSGSCITWLVT